MRTGKTAIITTSLLAIAMAATQCRSGQGSCDRCAAGNMEHGGRTRSFILYKPAARPRGSVPLIIVMHGGGGTAAGMIRITRGRFNQLAERDGFLVVYPEGYGRHWNDCRTDVHDRAHDANVDDVGFLSALIDLLVRERGVDPRRVFATGISNGGFMSFRLACQIPEKIRAIAPVTASMPVNSKCGCQPSRPVPVLVMNGTMDPLVPYDGGDIRLMGVTRGSVKSTDETVQFWLGNNACAGDTRTVLLPDIEATDGSTVEKTVYPSYGGTPCVTLYTVRGGGHTWPGGQQYPGKRLVGTVNRDINGCDEIWDFFRRLH